MNRCSNCGAAIRKEDAHCPYCGHMQYEAAEKSYMNKLGEVLTDVEDLQHQGTKIFKKNTYKVVGIVAALAVVCILIGYLVAKSGNYGNRYDAEYDQRVQDRHDWYDKNHEALQELWENRDLEGMKSLTGSYQSHLIEGWTHYDIYILWERYVSNGYPALMQDVENDYVSEGQFYYSVSTMIELALDELNATEAVRRYSTGLDPQEQVMWDDWRAEARNFLTEELCLTSEEILELRSIAKNNSLSYDDKIKAYVPYKQNWTPKAE